jgi:PII-like signaling protein
MKGSTMLKKGQAKKVTIFVNEDAKYHLTSLYEAILQYLLHKGVAGATATRAMAGFGPHHVMHTIKMETLMEHLPMRIEFIDTAETVDAVLPTLFDMVADGLIEVQDTTIVKAVMRQRQPLPKLPHQKKQGPAKMMRIYMGEADQWDGEPLYDAIIKRRRMMDISGATVYRGILGYGAKGETHKEHFFHISRDLPIMIAVIETPEKVTEAMEIVEGMIEDGLIVTSDVDMIRLVHANPLDEEATSGTSTAS